MENSWCLELWESTSPSFETPSVEILRQQSESVIQASKCILNNPHDPEFWLQRALHLLDLGFPELAAGDARKSSLLCKAMVSEDAALFEGVAKLQSGAFPKFEGGKQAGPAGQRYYYDHMLSKYVSAEEILLQSLYMMNDSWEALEICKQGKARFPGDPMYQNGFRSFKEDWYRKRSIMRIMREFEEPTTDFNYILVRGEAKFRPYPFLPTEHLHRSEKLVTGIQHILDENTSGKCTISNSPTLGATEGGYLGVIADTDVEVGTELVRELSLLVASSDNPLLQRSTNYKVCEFCCDSIQLQRTDTVSCEKCPATYCKKSCQNIAFATYHRVLCGEDFSWLYDVDKIGKPSEGRAVDKERAVQGALWLRVIALCVQEGCHPLESLTMVRLTSQYRHKTPQEWSLSGNIDRIHRILAQLGIDIFTDVRYDTWVMQTIWSRLMNNKLGKNRLNGRRISIIGSSWCFYNHSCEPNAHIAEMTNAAGNDTRAGLVISEATKPIKKGEEIFISYKDLAGQNKDSRQATLAGWLPEGCRCTKCERGE